MRNQLRVQLTSDVRTKVVAAACAFLVLVTACGASAGVEVTSEAATDPTPVQPDATDDTTDSAPVESAETQAEPEADEPASAPSIGQGTFELVLENGETFSAPVSCALEPQVAAGSEILFTVVGQHEGRVYDVTQWGETSFGGTQDVEIVDTNSFDSLWRATGSTGLVLELTGNVITGSGGFYPGEDLNGPKTEGQLTVTC